MNLIRYWKKRQLSIQREQIEDCLKYIYSLEESEQEINTKTLSALSGLSPKKQEQIFEILRQKALIGTDNKLSEEGESYALQILRRHRLYEKYLSEHSGYEATEWHSRACKEEHKLSESEQEALALQLGNPVFDPHGDPIPAADGSIVCIEGSPLASISEGTYALVQHIEDEPIELYKELAEIGIHRDALLYIQGTDKGQITFQFEGEEFSISDKVAALITANPCNNEERIALAQITRRLSKLGMGEDAEVIGISRALRGANRRRLLDLGFVRGSSIRIDLNGPFGNPKAYLVRGSSIALRSDQARYVLIKAASIGATNFSNQKVSL